MIKNSNEHNDLVEAIKDLGFGSGLTGPGAIESLAMAVAGDGLASPLSAAVADVAEQIGRVADALESIARKIRA
ncbi:hypothetical protein [Lamprocystis purpurea]|jgi:hypothetical protein|uniref:hypothetical protein n=1 Tax=Lamprocystis purpurea TaxID=61598 RepID=UPI00037A4E35|nr:hypothetical protein [Lamprocystis purpurea]